MKKFDSFEKENLKVLGLIVRVKRNKMGYSLRDLAQLTNISHTLISNFEQGKLIPNQDTIKDIFSVLDLRFYTDPLISEKFNKLYNTVFNHIIVYEYEDARRVIQEIEANQEQFENSVEAVNYAIIRCLFYSISNMYFADFDRILAQYEVVVDFLSPNQQQLYFFVKGLDFVNREYYYDARKNFEKALECGNKNLDLLIKEYYVISLSKANKYVDAGFIARECIVEFERDTNYIRAMRLRTRIAYDYYRINKFEEAEALYKSVLVFAEKFQVQDLQDRCNTRLAHLHFQKQDFKSTEEYINKVTVGYNKLYHYIKFDLVVRKRNDAELLKLYNEYINLEWVQQSTKTKYFFELILMRYDEKYMDKEKYENNLVELVELGLKADDGEMIEVACSMLATFYRNERRYKAAYEVVNTLLQYNKNGIEESIYNEDRNIAFYK